MSNNILCANSTITKVYRKANQTYAALGGEMQLTTATTTSIPCWFEENLTYTRGFDGDSWSSNPILIAGFADDVAEGDIIEVTPKTYTSETAITNLWRVAALTISVGMAYLNNTRNRTMELSLAPHKT
jgi:hypothetical protein